MTDQFNFESSDESDEPDESEPEGYLGERSLDDPFDEGYAPQEHWPVADEPDATVGDAAEATAFEQRLDSEEPEVEDDWDEDLASDVVEGGADGDARGTEEGR